MPMKFRGSLGTTLKKVILKLKTKIEPRGYKPHLNRSVTRNEIKKSPS
jgi:hypothetical protein